MENKFRDKILMALTIGENMFVAQYYGKKDFEGLRMDCVFRFRK